MRIMLLTVLSAANVRFRLFTNTTGRVFNLLYPRPVVFFIIHARLDRAKVKCGQAEKIT